MKPWLRRARAASVDYTTQVIADGGANLLGYWTLDAVSGLTDKSTGAHNGPAVGGVTIGGAAGPGHLTATTFDGVDDLVTTGLSPFTGAGIKTFECWSNRSSHATIDYLWASAAVNRAAFYLLASATTFHFFPNSADPEESWATYPGDSQWVHMMVVVNPATNVTSYVNGVAGATIATGAWDAGATTFTIGAGSSAAFNPFVGGLCHFAVYSGNQSAFALSHYNLGVS